MSYPDKAALLHSGLDVMEVFCASNWIEPPKVCQAERVGWKFDPCAYYRNSVTHICVAKCAAIGYAGRAWSYPGYIVDRTPYGVLQHELGHHVDVQRGTRRGPYWSDFSIALRGQSGESPITSYCPNDAEWFAEMFRVFVTNPDLLRLVRPRTYRELRSVFTPVFADSWDARIKDAPDRTTQAAKRHIEKAAAGLSHFEQAVFAL